LFQALVFGRIFGKYKHLLLDFWSKTIWLTGIWA
jgi:hypothetical protein